MLASFFFKGLLLVYDTCPHRKYTHKNSLVGYLEAASTILAKLLRLTTKMKRHLGIVIIGQE